jgi:hypothetical protein
LFTSKGPEEKPVISSESPFDNIRNSKPINELTRQGKAFRPKVPAEFYEEEVPELGSGSLRTQPRSQFAAVECLIQQKL